MDDVRAVMDAVGSERAVLMGISEGAPMSIAVRGDVSRTHGGARAVRRAWPARRRHPDTRGDRRPKASPKPPKSCIMPLVYTGGDIDVWAPSLDEDPAARNGSAATAAPR